LMASLAVIDPSPKLPANRATVALPV